MTFSIPLELFPFSCRDSHLFLGSEVLYIEGSDQLLALRCPQSNEQGPGQLLLLFYAGGKDAGEGIEISSLSATPASLNAAQDSLNFDAVFSSPRCLVFFGRGNLAFKTSRATKGAFAYRLSADCWRIDFPEYQRKLLVRIHEGSIDTDIAWNGEYGDRNRFFVTSEDCWTFSITDYEDGAILEDIISDPVRTGQWVANDWNEWLAAPVCLSNGNYESARLTAKYLQWSNQVGGRMGRSSPAIISSLANNAVSVVYEQCVHAVAIHSRHPQLAWKLWRGTFDLMSSSGQVPEQVSAFGRASQFSAPPVQGWALMQMIQRGWIPNPEKIQEAVECLEQNSRWWMQHSVAQRNGLPYYSHGRDAGWGESSLFLTPPPFQTPDLFAFLIVQLTTLIELYEFLGKTDEAEFWEKSRQGLMDFLQEKLWFGSEYITIGNDGDMICNTQSLLKMMPLILGSKLPSEHIKQLIGELQSGGYISEYGLASEAIGSRWFQRQSPQRGAVWPLGNYYLVRGLVDAGIPSLARSVCQNILRSVSREGFGEAYSVLSGLPIGNPNSPITASVFLAMLDEI